MLTIKNQAFRRNAKNRRANIANFLWRKSQSSATCEFSTRHIWDIYHLYHFFTWDLAILWTECTCHRRITTIDL